VSALVIQYQAVYQQTSAAAPTSTSSHQVSAYISFDTGNMPTIDDVRVAKPNGSLVSTSSAGSFYTTPFFNYSTREALMAAWPNGPYTFTVAVLDENDDIVETNYILQQPSGAGAWPSVIPAFSAASYNALQGMNPAQPLTLAVNAFAIAPPANTQMNGLTINQRFGAAQGPGVFSGLAVGGTPVFTKTVPANTLQPNTDYYASWIFEPRIQQSPPPAGVPYNHMAFGNITRVAFRTGNAVACPADIGAQGGAPGSDGHLDNNDFIVFIDYFFAQNPLADRGVTGGVPGTDGVWDNNDFIVFIDQFFAGC